MVVLGNKDAANLGDAYSTMVTMIKTYDEPPDHDVLKAKMPILQKFIERDLVLTDPENGILSADDRIHLQGLVVHALKAMVTIAWHPAYAYCMTDDFRGWTIDRAIKVLDECTASKMVVMHYMHLVATQHYRASILQSNDRALGILKALNKLDQHVTGKAIISERCLIYQRLTDQARATMKAHAGLWVKHLIMTMAHHVKDIRSSAISAGTRACAIFAGSQFLVTATRSALSETNGERTLSVSVTTRLEKVLQTKDEARQIPQIWAIVLIMANSQQNHIDEWSELTDWLKLLQRCFNCSDHAARVEAFTAWNHLYALVQFPTASEKVVSLLPKPAATQLEKVSDQSGRRTRQAAASSYTMLLYYAFRPSINSKQLTRSWNEYVVKIMTRKFLSKSRLNCDLCCKILGSMLFNTVQGPYVWKDDRARDSTQMSPTELPVLDSKWIRSKIDAVMRIVRLLIEHGFLMSKQDETSDAHATTMWKNLLLALKEAGSKEIIPSAESKAAQETIVKYLHSLVSECGKGISTVLQTKLDVLTSQVRIVFPALLGSSGPTTTAPESAIVAQKQRKQGSSNDNAPQERLLNQDQVQAECSSPAEPSVETSAKRLSTKVPRPKLTRRARHDDSQTEFIALQSSTQEPPDTQLMTIHQQETRDRQKLEPALVFADVRASPSSSKQAKCLSEPAAATRTNRILDPSTPPLADRNLEQADEMPGTPTPRTRKTMAFQLAPDVASSPASVLDQESGMRMSEVITSSPIKSQREDGELLYLSDLRANEDRERSEREQEGPPERLMSDAITVDMEVISDSRAHASTIDESDEFDALAASQLAESFEERRLIRNVTMATQDATPVTPVTKKRKRHDGYAGSDGKRKRKRRSRRESSQLSQIDSQITNSFSTERTETQGSENESDCIVVAPTICQVSIRPARISKTGSSNSLAASAKNVATSTMMEAVADIEQTPSVTTLSPRSPASNSKQRKRGRGRPKKRTSLAALKTDLEVEGTESLLRQEQGQADTDMADQTTTQQEVPHVCESPSSHKRAHKTPSDQIMHQEPYLEWEETLSGGTRDTNQFSMEGTACDKSETTASFADASMHTSNTFNLESHLQFALDSMDEPQQVRGNNFDFTTVYNLCARIGLRAQELAASWRR